MAATNGTPASATSPAAAPTPTEDRHPPAAVVSLPVVSESGAVTVPMFDASLSVAVTGAGSVTVSVSVPVADSAPALVAVEM